MRKARYLFGLAMAALLLAMSGMVPPPASASATGIIKRVYTDKARYSPGDTATIKVELTNDSGSAFSGSVNLTIHHLETQVHSNSSSISLPNGNSTTVTFTWTTPSTDFKGYFVKASAGSSQGATAIDVSSDWTRFPRYGYITEYPSESSSVTDARVKRTVEDYHTLSSCMTGCGGMRTTSSGREASSTARGRTGAASTPCIGPRFRTSLTPCIITTRRPCRTP